ncbi:MAG TPA: Uma2 family endonuclease [Gemmatimonadaceae bacterium]
MRWTRAMLEALPDDGQRHEIIDGVHYVTPSPATPHQFVVSRILFELTRWFEKHPVGWALISPSDIELGEDTIVQPDVLVLARTGNRPPRDWKTAGLPILAIEVLSPSTRSRDRIIKRPRYQRAGIAEYWIVDFESRLVERWRPEDERPEIVTDVLRWERPGATHALEIPLTPIFDLVAEA